MSNKFRCSLRGIPEDAKIENMLLMPVLQNEFQRHVVSMFQILGLNPDRDVMVIEFEKNQRSAS